MIGERSVSAGPYGQKINLTTYDWDRITMLLHDINHEKLDIADGDGPLDAARWVDKQFEAIVSNPPYSIHWDGDANPLLTNDPRHVPAGVLVPNSSALFIDAITADQEGKS